MKTKRTRGLEIGKKILTTIILSCCVIAPISAKDPAPVKEKPFSHRVNNPEDVPPQVQALFLNWKNQYQKIYNTPEEYIFRLQTFYENYLNIKSQASDLYTLGLNKFADITKNEFLSQYSGSIVDLNATPENSQDFPLKNTLFTKNQKMKKFSRKKNKRNTKPTHPQTKEHNSYERVLKNLKSAQNSTTVDWTKYLPPVKNQKQCSCSWAFSSIAAVEFQLNKQKNKPNATDLKIQSLSEQILLDCDTEVLDCQQGGSVKNALNFMKSGAFLDTGTGLEPAYVGVKQQCAKNQTLAAKVTKVIPIKPGDEDAMVEAVNNGVVAVSLDGFGIMNYIGGIFNGDCSHGLNHAMVIVGYGEETVVKKNDFSGDNEMGESEVIKYWVLRNSWGDDWGEGGYIRVMRGDDGLMYGVCGIYYAGFSVEVEAVDSSGAEWFGGEEM